MSSSTANSTQRFSNRVDDYVRYRPNYPDGLVDALATHAGLAASSIVADVGSGTGISTELILRRASTVYAVEPNAAMRAAAEARLGERPGFRSVAGTAEATTLSASSIDLVTAGQAFHWFEPNGAHAEFGRILRPGGWIGLFWNVRRSDDDPFAEGYEDLLRTYGTDYLQVTHRHADAEALRVFFDGEFTEHAFANAQVFDFEGLRGRLLSSSYAPARGHQQHDPMLAALRQLFHAHQRDGHVRFVYDTRLYLGRVDGVEAGLR